MASLDSDGDDRREAVGGEVDKGLKRGERGVEGEADEELEDDEDELEEEDEKVNEGFELLGVTPLSSLIPPFACTLGARIGCAGMTASAEGEHHLGRFFQCERGVCWEGDSQMSNSP